MGGTTDIVMPKLGLTMTEGLVAEWRVGVGDTVAKGEVLFVVETDKIANEVEAPGPGTVEAILVDAGATVPVGAPVARWTGPGLAAADAGAAPEMGPTEAVAAPEAAPAPAVRPTGGAGGRVVATPLARRIARERGIDLAAVAGSGPRGRIKAADLEGAAPAAAPAPAPSGARIAPDSVHKAMARRMVAAKRDVPHFYLSSEAEASALLDLRTRLNDLGDLPRITLNHMILAAAGIALAELPEANRIWVDDEFLALAEPDVGVAVQTERGLFAPVIRNAGRLGLDGIAREADRLAAAARAGTLAAGELDGGALTVSNAGMHNVTRFAPIVNPPQAAILGVGSVREVFRPDAEGRPALRREIGLVLSCDHRVLDGVRGLELLNRIIALLESPLRLLRAV